MHDPRGKNRFTKLSDVERTATALSAARQTTGTLFFFSSFSFFFFFFLFDNGESSQGTATPLLVQGGERIYREFVRFIYREIFSGPGRIRTERRPEVISRLLRDELRRCAALPRPSTEIRPTKTFFFLPGVSPAGRRHEVRRCNR